MTTNSPWSQLTTLYIDLDGQRSISCRLKSTHLQVMSCIFRSVNFMPGNLVLQFHVCQFHAWTFGLYFMSVKFMPGHFDGPSFSGPSFSAPPYVYVLVTYCPVVSLYLIKCAFILFPAFIMRRKDAVMNKNFFAIFFLREHHLKYFSIKHWLTEVGRVCANAVARW